jgi:alpha-N-arabinofuranosidase
VIQADQGKDTINREIYGHFAEHLGRCIYEGFWVGPDSPIPNTNGIRNDVVAALRKLDIPVLRWPGGCFADEYHWKDGIGPRDKRPKMVNTHWGMVTETNAFGTHEFFELCQMLGCKAYVAGNVGSGTPEEMQDWVEYITFAGDSEMANLRRANGRMEPWKLDYFGVGNENWGCGGNMTPEYYANVYKRYQTFVKNLSGQRPIKIACGSNSADYNWMEVVMRDAGRQINMISLHHYVMSGSWRNKGRATVFDESEWFNVLEKTVFADELISKCTAIMDKYDQRKRVGLAVDEWGTWWNVEEGENPGFLYQQNTLRDAVVAGVFLNIFNSHADRVKMGCIAQTNNVLQAMVLTKGDKMIVTPTYYVFEMYKVHQGATLLPGKLECSPYQLNNKTIPSLNASASKDKQGVIHISLCNLDPQKPGKLECELTGVTAKKVSGQILTSDKMNAHNTFEQPNAIGPVEFKDVEIKDGKILTTLPAKSVVMLTVE